MPLYVISFQDKPGALETRMATRPAHLEYVKSLGDAMRLGGPFLNDEGKPTGTLMIVEAADEAAARAINENDPYNKAGLFERAEVRLWNCVKGPLAP